MWRPSIDDVHRISQGDAARSRGTGSRAVPHRLNADERKQYDLAKSKGLLTLAGSGYRRERKGSPLANIWRQWCDANALPCVLLSKGATAAGGDTVIVDLSTLRLPDVSQHRDACRAIASHHGLAPQAQGSPALQSPFTVILPSKLASALLAEAEAEAAAGSPGSPGSSSQTGGEQAGSPSGEAATGRDDASEPAAASGGTASAVAEILEELRGSSPIWEHPPLLECFTADRARAKALAKQLADDLAKGLPAEAAAEAEAAAA